MPLIHKASKKAFEKNVATEMEANPGDKHRAQNLAIAYSVKRKAGNKMADGGLVDEGMDKAGSMEADKKASRDSMQDDGMDQADTMARRKAGARAMARGGMVERGAGPEMDLEPHMSVKRPSLSMGPSMDEYDADHFAYGGEAEEDGEPASIAAAVSRRRKARAMAEGGQVDLEANSEESPNMEDQYSFEANGKEQYDLDQGESDPMDSNETGDSREDSTSDDHDMIASIMSRMKSKRK